MHLIWRTKGYEPLYIEMTDHPALYPVDRWAARWLSMMTVRSRPGWPRLGISNPWFRRESASMTRTYAAGYDVPQLSWTSPSPPPPRTWRVVRFPGWPHGNRTHNGSTSAACKAREVGRGDPTCPPPRALSMRRGSMGPLWPITRSMACNTGISHQECTICSFAVLSPLPKCTGVHYFHASRWFRPSVWLQVPFAPHAWFRRTLARLFLARDP